MEVIKIRGHHIPSFERLIQLNKEDREWYKKWRYDLYQPEFFDLADRIAAGARVKIIAGSLDSMCKVCSRRRKIKYSYCFGGGEYDKSFAKEWGLK